MSDDDNNQRRPSLVFWLVLVVVMLPVAYVLSAGPAVWLYNHGYLGVWAAGLYWPLDVGCDHCLPLRKVRDWYLAFWS